LEFMSHREESVVVQLAEAGEAVCGQIDFDALATKLLGVLDFEYRILHQKFSAEDLYEQYEKFVEEAIDDTRAIIQKAGYPREMTEIYSVSGSFQDEAAGLKMKLDDSVYYRSQCQRGHEAFMNYLSFADASEQKQILSILVDGFDTVRPGDIHARICMLYNRGFKTGGRKPCDIVMWSEDPNERLEAIKTAREHVVQTHVRYNTGIAIKLGECSVATVKVRRSIRSSIRDNTKVENQNIMVSLNVGEEGSNDGIVVYLFSDEKGPDHYGKIKSEISQERLTKIVRTALIQTDDAQILSTVGGAAQPAIATKNTPAKSSKFSKKTILGSLGGLAAAASAYLGVSWFLKGDDASQKNSGVAGVISKSKGTLAIGGGILATLGIAGWFGYKKFSKSTYSGDSISDDRDTYRSSDMRPIKSRKSPPLRWDDWRLILGAILAFALILICVVMCCCCGCSQESEKPRRDNLRDLEKGVARRDSLERKRETQAEGM